MIEAHNIHKSYGSLNVLQGVNVSIGKGEIVSIVGKSGAGKSTLLHILGTLDLPDSGTVKIDGENVVQFNKTNLAQFRNRKIGFVFQFHHLLPEFTALENVCIPGYIQGKAEKDVRQEAKELLDYLGLGERLEHKPNELSGGEQQRVAIARALINKPMVIFADEPTGNLDSQTSEELHALLFDLRRDFNQTFVIVTHNPELAKMSDRTLQMEDGRIING